jgi:hypothetical protein
LSVLEKTLPKPQKIFDITTRIFSSFSIDIGVMKTCFNGYRCYQNNQIQIFLPFVQLPGKEHVLMFVLGLSCLVIAFM